MYASWVRGPSASLSPLNANDVGLSVLALEAGGEKEKRFRWPSEDELSNRKSHAPVHVTTRSAFGGTSWAWAGRCVAFDDIDFHDRAHVAHSGWPLTHEAVAPYYESAARILNCRESVLRFGGEQTAADRSLAETVFFVSSQPKLAISYWDHFAKSPSITLALNSRVTALNLGSDGNHVRSLTVVSGGRTVVLKPPRVVLAAGGLKTTQLLLAAQRQWPHQFGGPEGALGRYYMGHLAGSIASVTFRDSRSAPLVPPQPSGGAARRLTISATKQISERLLNVAFWPDMPLFYDPSHAERRAVCGAARLRGAEARRPSGWRISPLLSRPRASTSRRACPQHPRLRQFERPPASGACSGIGSCAGRGSAPLAREAGLGALYAAVSCRVGTQSRKLRVALRQGRP